MYPLYWSNNYIKDNSGNSIPCILSPKCPNIITPIGLAINPAANVSKDKIKAVVSLTSPKNAEGKISAAAAPYKKKSYHSILVPAREVKATFCMFDFF